MNLKINKTSQNLPFELINPNISRGRIKFAIFDFDGTISLIREGWQQIMIPMMVEILMQTPRHESREEVNQAVKTFVANTTGKQTIYQMIHLSEEIEKRGGHPKDPLVYKEQYHDLLMERIENRIKGLGDEKIKPEEMVVPGSLQALEHLRRNGIKCFLASGTDEKYVFHEAELLGITEYFEGIYGALDDYENFSKQMVIQKIIRRNHLSGPELIAFGDGFVEIEDTKAAGGIAIGLATDESERSGIDHWKRNRLIASGADVILPDFTEFSSLWQYLMEKE